MKLQLLVTGTGHCGTRYVTDLLKAAGLKTSHEAIYGAHINRDAIGNWEAEASGPAAAFLDTIPDHTQVIHLVRCPLRTIRSMFYRKNYGWPWRRRAQLESILGVKLPEEPKELFMAFYALWNNLITESKRASHRIRIEDCPEALLAAANLTCNQHVAPKGSEVPRGTPFFTWTDLPQNSPWIATLKSLAETYGYTYDDRSSSYASHP